jgi:hypothetical protein
MKIWRMSLYALLGLGGCMGAAMAHHSTAEFDYSKNLKLAGKVVEVQWMNPHSFIEVLVPGGGPGGTPQRWSIEIGSPNINTRIGWKKTTVKPGDQVSMEIAPTRDGKPRGTLRILTLPDGRKIKGIAGLTVSDKNGAPLIDASQVSSGSAPKKTGSEAPGNKGGAEK